MDSKEMDAHGSFLIDYGRKNGIIFRLTRKTFSIEVLDKTPTTLETNGENKNG